MRQVPTNSRITLLTSIGAGLEYYDYVIYYLLANYISQQFFPTSNHAAALFATFSLFAASNLIRPLASTIIGMLGDRYGRKNIFANTLLFMAFGSFFMGILPSFSSWGITATIIFCLLRILQGVTFGAELPGALTFLLEHIRTKNRGLHCGLMISSIGLGVTFGSFVTYLLTKFLTDAQMLNWGFRIPLILGGGLAFVGFLVRKTISETPLFTELKHRSKNTLIELGTNYLAQTLKGIGIVLFPSSMVTFFLALPVYLHDIYHYQYSDIYLATTLGYLWVALLIPIFGKLSDVIGRKYLFFAALLIMIFCGVWVFGLLDSGTKTALFSFVGICQGMLGIMAASYFVLLPESFPTEIRYTGTAFSYNIAYAITASVPLIANYIYTTLKHPHLLVWMFVAFAVLSGISLATLKNHFGIEKKC